MNSKKFLHFLVCMVMIESHNCLFELALDSGAKGVNIIQETGHVMLVGYFGVHARNDSTATHCGRLIHDSGIVLVEAMRYAVNKINEKSLLFGYRVGYRIVDSCKNTATLRRSLFLTLRSEFYMGIVGPPTSDEAILAAAVHSAYKAAVVSNSASSTVFRDRNTYYNFFRTISSDLLQAYALVDLANHFNWTYVSTVNSYGTYGQRGMDTLVLELEQNFKCVAKRINLHDVPTDAGYKRTVSELLSVERATVVILITTPADTRGLLEAAKDVRTLTWVSSTSWYADKEIIKGVEESAKGSLILQNANTYSSDFYRNFTSLQLNSNNYTWFREFWSEVFNCRTSTKNADKPWCTGNENLNTSSFYGLYSPVKPVLSAVESVVCALRNGMLSICSGNVSCISKILTTTYKFEEIVVTNLKNGSSACKDLNNSVNMNSNGFYPRGFTVANFDGISYRTVGRWTYDKANKIGQLEISDKEITWKKNKVPTSICSSPCKKGEAKIQSFSDDICCFTCKSCGHNQIVKNESCFKCGEYERANDDMIACVSLPSVYIIVSNAAGLITIIGSCIGIILSTVFFAIFFKNRKSRIVKASSRELSFIIIMALYMCFVSPFILLSKPTRIVCGIQRFIIGLSLTGCYTPLMLKTNRIYRIFRASQTMISKPVFVGSRSQILICMGLIGVQLLLGIMWVVGDPPTVVKKHIKEGTQVAVICKFDASNVILNLLPCFVLMAVCTVFAFKTRKFPSNFNEAYSIGITMYVSCFAWGVFIPLILFLELGKDNVFVITYVESGFTIIVGLITLIGLFGPKLKKLIFEKHVAPAQEMFSEFYGKPDTRKHTVENPMETITEDVVNADDKRVMTLRFRMETVDASTNT